MSEKNDQPRLVVGDPTPNFQLSVVDASLEQGIVASSDYSGSWLAILFYPRDFSFVCPTELTAFSAQLRQFADRNCELLGVSIDSIDSHRRWLQTSVVEGGVEGLRFPLASDPKGTVCRHFGVWRSDGLPNRGLFLIDPSGIVRYSVIHDLAVGRDVESVLRILDALQSGGLCPANWTESDGTLNVSSLLVPGRVLGHFRIERQLGKGSFGIVLEAFDLRLERRTALKVLNQGGDETTRALLGEARAAASIHHDGVCSIYSVEEIDGLPTIVMEYVEGKPLSSLIADLEPTTRFGIARQIAEGVQAAHRNGVVHGDLKPGNILLTKDSFPVIVDFGLAKTRGSRSSPPKTLLPASESKPLGEIAADETVELDNDQDLNQENALGSGKISGTPAYMAPEIARGAASSEASDVFSLGVIFVELLSGGHPYKHLQPMEIMVRLRNPEFVQSFVSQLDPEIQPLVGDMLKIDPEQRISASEVIARSKHFNVIG